MAGGVRLLAGMTHDRVNLGLTRIYTSSVSSAVMEPRILSSCFARVDPRCVSSSSLLSTGQACPMSARRKADVVLRVDDDCTQFPCDIDCLVAPTGQPGGAVWPTIGGTVREVRDCASARSRNRGSTRLTYSALPGCRGRSMSPRRPSGCSTRAAPAHPASCRFFQPYSEPRADRVLTVARRTGSGGGARCSW